MQMECDLDSNIIVNASCLLCFRKGQEVPNFLKEPIKSESRKWVEENFTFEKFFKLESQGE